MSEVEHPSGMLDVTVTFKNKSALTLSAFKAQIEAALESPADDLEGEIFFTEGHESSGVIIGNG